MKKPFLLGFIVLVFAVSNLLSGQIIVVKVKVQVANIRAEPDPNSAKIKQIPLGTLLEARTKIKDWYEIAITDEAGNVISGYIHSAVVDVISGEEKKEVQPKPIREPVREEPRRPVDMTPERITFEDDYASGGFKLLGGLTLANISTSDTSEFDIDQWKKSKQGFFGGIGYEMGSRVALEIDVLYLQKGVKFEGSYKSTQLGIDSDFNLELIIDEVSVPVLIKFRLMRGSTPYILAGGEIAYISSSKVKYNFTDRVAGLTQSGTEDAKESTKEIDYGLVFGVGFELNTGPIPLMIEGRYHLGLADIAGTDEDYPQVQADDWIKTSALIVLLGIKF